MSLVVVQPRQLVAFQPAGPLASTPRLGIAPARLPEDQRQTRPRLRHRQRRRPLFSPASPPRPGTTPPAATAPCGGATPASSSPGTRPALPRSYRASGTPRSGAPPSPPAPIPPAAPTERPCRGDHHTSTCPPSSYRTTTSISSNPTTLRSTFDYTRTTAISTSRGPFSPSRTLRWVHAPAGSDAPQTRTPWNGGLGWGPRPPYGGGSASRSRIVVFDGTANK